MNDYEEYLALTGRRDWQFPPVWYRHMAMEIGMALYEAVNSNELGETLPGVGVQLSPTAFFIPDIVFIRAERRHIVGTEYVEGAPDPVIEVPAPSTPPGALLVKRALYQQNAIPECWFVNVEAETIDLLTSDEEWAQVSPDMGLLVSRVVPTFQVDLGKLSSHD